jgi:four helix bundle protein
MQNKDGELSRRTRAFAVAAVRFVEALPSGRTEDILGRQLLRAATSVGANYRAACRAKSKADFINKLGNVEEEADESHYWLEMMAETGVDSSQERKALTEEANQITAMVVASIKSARRGLR